MEIRARSQVHITRIRIYNDDTVRDRDGEQHHHQGASRTEEPYHSTHHSTAAADVITDVDAVECNAAMLVWYTYYTQ